MIEELKCPECEGKMVPRNGKFGKFWGCKNYPDCTGTRDSSGLSKYDRDGDKDVDDSVKESSDLPSTRFYKTGKNK